MKDALGHGSNAHNSGIAKLGETRYHVVKKKFWQEAQKRGYLDPNKYSMGKGIWTSTHDDDYYSKKFEAPFSGVKKDEVQLAITLHPRYYHPTPGNENGGSADRVTRVKVPLDRIKVVEPTLPSIDEYRKAYYSKSPK